MSELHKSGPRYRILGGPGSPFSLKMRAVLRYRQLPHTWLVPPVSPEYPVNPELKAAAKGVLPVLQLPEGQYWSDTTPMILALEKRHPHQRSVLPDDPVHRFLARLIEDFADEWLVKVVFDYRWNLDVDQDFCSRRQTAARVRAMPEREFTEIVTRFRDRQVRRLASQGDTERNRPLLQSSYRQVLAAIESQLVVQYFLFGNRPSIADFGLFGQLSQLAIDPSASIVMRREAIRTFQWVQDIDDLSGIDGEWQDREAPLGPGVNALLRMIGEIYLPYLVTNAAAHAAGEATTSLELRGLDFVAETSAYKARCLLWLKQALDEIDQTAKPRLQRVLQESGCWDLLQFAPDERKSVPPLDPGNSKNVASI
jgi:glutathione S-transferase